LTAHQLEETTRLRENVLVVAYERSIRQGKAASSTTMPVGQAGKKRKLDRITDSGEEDLLEKLHRLGWPLSSRGQTFESNEPRRRLQYVLLLSYALSGLHRSLTKMSQPAGHLSYSHRTSSYTVLRYHLSAQLPFFWPNIYIFRHIQMARQKHPGTSIRNHTPFHSQRP
jgi:hypothetical protein